VSDRGDLLFRLGALFRPGTMERKHKGKVRRHMEMGITLDSTPTTIIGVAPQGFHSPSPKCRLWKPLDLNRAKRQ